MKLSAITLAVLTAFSMSTSAQVTMTVAQYDAFLQSARNKANDAYHAFDIDRSDVTKADAWLNTGNEVTRIQGLDVLFIPEPVTATPTSGPLAPSVQPDKIPQATPPKAPVALVQPSRLANNIPGKIPELQPYNVPGKAPVALTTPTPNPVQQMTSLPATGLVTRPDLSSMQPAFSAGVGNPQISTAPGVTNIIPADQLIPSPVVPVAQPTTTQPLPQIQPVAVPPKQPTTPVAPPKLAMNVPTKIPAPDVNKLATPAYPEKPVIQAPLKPLIQAGVIDNGAKQIGITHPVEQQITLVDTQTQQPIVAPADTGAPTLVQKQTISELVTRPDLSSIQPAFFAGVGNPQISTAPGVTNIIPADQLIPSPVVPVAQPTTTQPLPQRQPVAVPPKQPTTPVAPPKLAMNVPTKIPAPDVNKLATPAYPEKPVIQAPLKPLIQAGVIDNGAKQIGITQPVEQQLTLVDTQTQQPIVAPADTGTPTLVQKQKITAQTTPKPHPVNMPTKKIAASQQIVSYYVDTQTKQQVNNNTVGIANNSKAINTLQQQQTSNNQRFSNIENQQGEDRKEYRAGIAGAASIAGLHYVDTDNAISMGAANFKDAQGYAMGYRHKFSENAATTIAISGTSNGDEVVAGSVSVGW